MRIENGPFLVSDTRLSENLPVQNCTVGGKEGVPMWVLIGLFLSCYVVASVFLILITVRRKTFRSSINECGICELMKVF